MDTQLDVVGTASMSPLNNYDSDYVAGWVMGITFEVSTYGPCEIPMNPIIPTPVECQDGSVENSDGSYVNTVASGGLLVLPDVNLVVFDQNGNVLSNEIYPSVQDESIIVTIPECADASYTITDTQNNTLYSGTIPSGGSLDQTINNTSVSNSNDSYTASVLAQGSLELPDVTFSVENSLENVVWSATIPSVNNSIGFAPDGTAHLKKENDGTIANVLIPSGVSTEYTILNNDITVNALNPFEIHATDPLNIRLHNQSGNDITPQSVVYQGNSNHVTITLNTASFAPVGATLMKTGQTTSYRTGDDGDLEAGRATSFTVLASNNPFGNTNRFTDELGGQTYTKNIVIDWSTYNGSNVLGYYRTVSAINVTWNAAIDAALALSIVGFTSGWRLPNKREMENIFNYSLTFGISYSPFNFPNNAIWTSTTYTASTTIAYTHAGSWINLTAKSGADARWIACRTFTVTGTTLS
jgi:hypothetical protein